MSPLICGFGFFSLLPIRRHGICHAFRVRVLVRLHPEASTALAASLNLNQFVRNASDLCVQIIFFVRNRAFEKLVFLREDTRNALSNSFSAFPLRDRMGGKSKKINCLLFSCLSRVFIHFEALFCFTSDSFSTLFFTPGVSRNETENWK